MAENPNRKLTDEDIEAIAEALEMRLSTRFYGILGRGLWGMVWRSIFLGMLGLAALSAFGKKD